VRRHTLIDGIEEQLKDPAVPLASFL
jgi:hypothetical protein